jgi:hypothetical protein
MNCAEFQELLPDLMEGDHDVTLEAHLKTCPECSELLSDLEAISEQSRLLSATEEPSPRVWQSIASQLRREGLIRDSQLERPFLVSTTRRRWRPTMWLLPVAAVLVFGFAFLMSRPPAVPVAGNRATTPELVASAVMDESDRQILAELQKTAPLMEAAYERSLIDVNAYIADAQRSVNENPGDDDARESLMQAREQKSMLYEMALERSLP